MAILSSTILFVLLLILLFSYKTQPIISEKLGHKFHALAGVQAIVLSLQVGFIFWNFFQAMPQNFGDFISGRVGFLMQNKSAEFHAIYLAILFFVLAYFIICWIYSGWVSKTDSMDQVGKLSLYSLIPSAFLIGQWLTTKTTIYLLGFSSASILIGLVTILGLRFLNKFFFLQLTNIFEIGVKIILTFYFFILSGAGVIILFTRTGCLNCKRETGLGWIVLVALVILMVLSKKNELRRKINVLVVASQIPIPLLLSAFLSPPIYLKNGGVSRIDFNNELYILLIALCFFAWLDIYKRFKKMGGAPDEYGMISPWVLLIILISLQPNYISWPSISPDDYHAGEFYLPWWLFDKHNYLPYLEYQPTRGLVNYVPGLLSWLFFDNTLSGQSVISNLFSSLYISLGFLAIRHWTDDFVAFLVCSSTLSAAFTGLAGGAIVIIFSLVVLFKSINRYSFLVCLWIWLVLSLSITIYQITEAAAFILCTIPLGIYLTVKSYQKSRKQLVLSLIFLLIFLITLVVFTNVDSIGITIFRYILEQASVNDVAHGVIWQYPPRGEAAQMISNGPLWQFFRFSWILLIVPIVYRIATLSRKDKPIEALFLVAYLILCISLIPRSANRIDAVAFSRPYSTSIILVVFGAPMLLPAIGNSNKRASSLLIMALLFGVLGSQERFLQSPWKLINQIIREPPQTVYGSAIGLGGVGESVLMDANQVERQMQIKSVLDQILLSDETYYNLTNHNSDYAFQMRPNPVPYTSFYNAPTTSQQVRAINELERRGVPLVLIDGENILWDGGPLSLRSYHIYQYLLGKYLPFQDEFGRTWMIRKNETDRLSKTNYSIVSEQEVPKILNLVFRQKDLQGIPASWGNSYESLNSKLRNPIDILSSDGVSNSHNLKEKSGEWTATGNDPWLVFSLPSNVQGDMLYIEVEQANCRGQMQIFWSTNLYKGFTEDQSFVFNFVGSQFLIPVSSAPSWALSDYITEIRIDVPNRNCRVRFNNIVLYERIINYE